MTLPEVPKAKGYQNLGWTTARGKTKPLYKAGAKVKIAKHTKFYAVRRKSRYYTVNFYTKNGGMNSNYSGLQKKVEENSAITIPSVPARKGYVNLGWSAKRGSSSVAAKAGSSLKVTKNLKFYAAQEKAVSVVLHKNDGTVYKTITMGEGNYLSLPSVANAPGYTFMGWSKTMGQTADPQYEAGEKLRITEETHLYAVVFSRATETNIDEDNMAQPDLRKFKQIIFVGDSRTVRMKNVMEKEFDSYMTNGVRFIGGTGQGLEWLKTNGYGELMSIVGNDVSNVLAKPTAVIFNLGVNDLYNSAEYVAYMNEIAGTLKQKNCKLFYMSVNPVNSKMHAVTGHAVRKEEDVRLFNSRIRLGLSQNYIYIDTYAWLMKNGYSTDECKYGVDMDVDDGLHYGAKTYKRIYYYCLNFIM